MRIRKLSRMSICVGAAVAVLLGCGNNDMSKDEIAAASHSKPPTAQQMAGLFQAGANAAKQHELDWIKTHSPEQVAEVNKQRAAVGKPPLGK